MTRKKIWSKGGYGCTDYIDSDNFEKRLNFHIINSGKISRHKFIKVVSKITNDSMSWLYDHVLLAGNDAEFLLPVDDDKIVFLTPNPRSINDVWLKFDLNGNLVWMRNDISEEDQKMIFEKYGELKIE